VICHPKTATAAATVALIVGAGCLLVILVWQGWIAGGNPDPLAPGINSVAGVLDIGVLVFREGLECILVLAAVTAGMSAAGRGHGRPIVCGAGVALLCTFVSWWIAAGIIDDLGTKISALALQAATGLLAVAVLLVVMNWFFHKVYWTGWISLHTRKKQALLQGASGGTAQKGLWWGLALLQGKCPPTQVAGGDQEAPTSAIISER
jgi:high-affinity iron transporter